MSLASGSSLSHYQILAPLGAGAMGEVYRAKDSRLDREVAIKVLPEHFADDAERLKRFEREAKTLASLNHPNVAQIFGVDQVGDICFIVLELVPGETLDERLKRGPLPIDEALDVCKQIAEGLEAAHEAGVIHRDLKPANVRVTPDGKVKVLDFGLAKPANEMHQGSSTDSVLSTEAGRLLGTPTYMAPEQARGKSIDKRVDIWAFGCVLFECLTAQRAFAGETLSDVFASVLAQEPEWKRLPAATPARVRELLQRCFAKDPRARLRDIGEARLLLSSSAPEHVAPRASRPATLVLVVLVALLAGGIGTTFFFRGARTPPGPGAFRRINLRTEAVFRAAFAPDGRTVVYSAAAQGNKPELFVVRPETPEPQSLGLHETQLLSVSSKGELAVLVGARFLGHRLFIGTLARIPLGGGAPREILENVREADWTPNGEQLAILRELGGRDRIEFPTGHVLCESTGYMSDLRFSPAGDRIAYFEHPSRWDDRGAIHVVDLKGHTTRLAGDYASEEGIAWAPDGREVFYSASDGGMTCSVHAVTPDGQCRVAYQNPGGLTIQDINRDGHWLATQDTLPYGVMVRTPAFAEDRELQWLGSVSEGVLSQDGRVLAFCEEADSMGPNYAACLRGTDGSPVARLGEGHASDLSRDGKWLLSIIPSSPPKLVLYPTGPGEQRQLERDNIELYTQARWFRDGSRVLINAAEPGKGQRFYIQEIAGGMPRAVTPEGTRKGLLSPDGRSILARGPDDNYFLYPLDGGEARPVPALTLHDTLVHWRVDGKSVLVNQRDQIPCRIESVALETGKRELFKEIAPSDLVGLISLRPLFFTDDERSYVYEFERQTSGLFVSEGRE